MSTPDVPGHRPSNNDKLAKGCWAEHKDGSLLLVHALAEGQVVYSLYDPAKAHEWPDSKPQAEFSEMFSWNDSKQPHYWWTWHDKTAFPWDRITELPKSAPAPLAVSEPSAAEKVGRDLALRMKEIGPKLGPAIKREIADFGKAIMGKLPD